MTDDQRKMIYNAEEQSLCGRGAVIMINQDTGAIKLVPTFCHSWRCERCGPRLAAIWRRKIIDSDPERFITLTCDPSDKISPDQALDQMKSGLKKLSSALRDEGLCFEYCAIWEFTKKGWPHIHLAQRGSFIPQERLSELWASFGCGAIVDIRRVRSREALSFELTKYLLKSVRNTAILMTGRRIIQTSRGFLKPPLTAEVLDPRPSYLSLYLSQHLSDICTYLERYEFYELVTSTHDGVLFFLPTSQPFIDDDTPQGFQSLHQALEDFRATKIHAPPDDLQSEGQPGRPFFNPELVRPALSIF